MTDYCLNLPPPFISLSPAIDELVANEKSVNMIKLNNVAKLNRTMKFDSIFSKKSTLKRRTYSSNYTTRNIRAFEKINNLQWLNWNIFLK